MRLPVLFVLSLAALLSGCELLGLDAPQKLAAAREADGKAIGSACRHAGRAIEDCYLLNARAQRAAVFAGWREMDEYMRENQVEAVPPQLSRSPASEPAADMAQQVEAAPAEGTDKSAKTPPSS